MSDAAPLINPIAYIVNQPAIAAAKAPGIASKKAGEQRAEMRRQQSLIEAQIRERKKRDAATQDRDQRRALQKIKASEFEGRGTTILTQNMLGSGGTEGNAAASGVGAATSSGVGKTLLGT